MVKNRLIFTLHLNRGMFQLSRNFSLQAVGDLRWLRNSYHFDAIAHAIDELVVLNVARSTESIVEFAATLTELTKNIFIPVAVGGWIRSLDDAFLLMRSGADKLVLNTPLFHRPELVQGIVKTFGSQCVIGSIDYRRNGGPPQVRTGCGKELTSLTIDEAVSNALSLGVGELYITCIDKDGTGQGYDIETLRSVVKQSSVPVIASGGVGNEKHLVQGITEAHVNAVSTAHLFNFVGEGLTEARRYMKEQGINLAHW